MDAQGLREKMKEKAQRLAGGSDEWPGSQSTKMPTDKLDADVKTGARPISKQHLKTGGKVQGAAAQHHAGRVARKSGGKVDKIGDDIINRNVKEANEDREGKKHVGGWKKGGRTGKLYGGGLYGMENEHSGHGPFGMKKGGKAAKASGGKIKKAPGGIILNDEDIRSKPGVTGVMPAPTTPMGGKRPVAVVEETVVKAPKVSAATANGSIAPVARLGRNFSDMLTPAMDTSVEPVKSAKGKKSGGRTAKQDGGRAKGKTNINIIIAPQGGQKEAPIPPPVMDAPPPMDMPPPMPMKPPIAAGPAMGMPPGPPAGLAAALGRKDGGKVIHMEHGAGGGLGRLEKIKKYGAKA